MISVIIPSSGSLENIQSLCRSLLNQRTAEEYEVFVVCNPPNSAVEAFFQELPSHFKYLSTTKRGVNSARNLGIAKAQGRFLFFFDDDCELPSETFVTENSALLEKHSDILACGGAYLPKYTLASGLEKAYYFIQSKWLLEGQNDQGFHRYLIGGNMAFRAEAFSQYGPFNEDLKFGGTETEFFRRLNEEKLLFRPESSVLHDYRIGLREFFKKAFMQGVGRSFMAEKCGKPAESPVVYGHQAMLQILGLEMKSRRPLTWYRMAFHAGENYYLRTRQTRPSGGEIFFAVLKALFWKKKLVKTFLDRRLNVVDNYRRHLEYLE